MDPGNFNVIYRIFKLKHQMVSKNKYQKRNINIMMLELNESSNGNK